MNQQRLTRFSYGLGCFLVIIGSLFVDWRLGMIAFGVLLIFSSMPFWDEKDEDGQ